MNQFNEECRYYARKILLCQKRYKYDSPNQVIKHSFEVLYHLAQLQFTALY